MYIIRKYLENVMHRRPALIRNVIKTNNIFVSHSRACPPIHRYFTILQIEYVMTLVVCFQSIKSYYTILQVKYVLLFAYMRGGSSFFGETFLSNPNAFYFYEPDWDVYAAMVAAQTMVFPLHTTFYENGTFR